MLMNEADAMFKENDAPDDKDEYAEEIIKVEMVLTKIKTADSADVDQPVARHEQPLAHNERHSANNSTEGGEVEDRKRRLTQTVIKCKR
ncbi:hypothetical protein PsorP6_012396 [Peronosclerospora sorghi]|uniref:Uncharacterized protein n=1 Tax=Peronosclerospora sorghi TaxID=230839 RepID=A0ACC0WEJ4_9STRA|nr:hypothetical protein PsorP6_012396 [Peronosclerospora sorghi]